MGKRTRRSSPSQDDLTAELADLDHEIRTLKADITRLSYSDPWPAVLPRLILAEKAKRRAALAAELAKLQERKPRAEASAGREPPEPPPATIGRPPGTGYASQDAPHVKEILERVAQGKAKSPTEAAAQIVREDESAVAGVGSFEAKVRRLATRATAARKRKKE